MSDHPEPPAAGPPTSTDINHNDDPQHEEHTQEQLEQQKHQQDPLPVSKKFHQGFEDCFWSSDYATGLNVLFDKLDQGVVENSQILDFISRRISLESAYAANLKSASENVMTSRQASAGFDRDEGASAKQAFVAFLDESSTQGELHSRIAAGLERQVREPFSQYAEAHKSRVSKARSTLLSRLKSYNKSTANVHKAQQTYYAKARQLEELTNSSVPVMVASGGAVNNNTSARSLSMAISSSASAINKRLSLAQFSKGAEPTIPEAAESSSSATKEDEKGKSVTKQSTISEDHIVTPPTASADVTAATTTTAGTTAPTPQDPPTRTASLPRQNSLSGEVVIFGGQQYTPKTLQELLQDFLTSVPQETFKIPIIGSYPNVSTGEGILHYIRINVGINNIGIAEKYGQDMVDQGFLRLVGAVGSRFSGTSNSRYQWLPRATEFAKNGVYHQSSTSEKLSEIQSTIIAEEQTATDAASTFAKKTSNIVSGYFSSLLANTEDESKPEGNIDAPPSSVHKRHESMSILSSLSRAGTLNGKSHSRTASSADFGTTQQPLPRRESQISKLQREITELDEKYQIAVRNLDDERCGLELEIFELYPFMQQCERDRLRAVKKVLLDFTAGIGRTLNNLHQSVQRMAFHESLLDPIKDLDYLIERYKTGPFAPKPVVYMGFFKSHRIQSFGVDLKFVPFVVEDFVGYISDEKNVTGKDEEITSGITEFPSISTGGNSYKSRLTSDTSRNILIGLWTQAQAPIDEIQALRRKINTSKKFNPEEAFKGYTLPTVISTLREFLLELPDSIISSTVYDVIKSAYSKSGPGANVSLEMALEERKDAEASNAEQRVERLVGLLTHLERENLSNLKVLISHFADICKVSSESTPFKAVLPEDIPDNVKDLSRSIAPYLLKPRATTSLTLTEKHPMQLTQDLIIYRDVVFSQVEARLEKAQKNRRRSRSASGSEANRRFHIEERNKAIAAAHGVNNAGTITPSHSSSSIAAIVSGGSANGSPPSKISGPLPLTLSSSVRSRHSVTNSDASDEGRTEEGSTDGPYGELTSGSNLRLARPLSHRRTPSGNKLSIRSFLEPGGGISRSSTPTPGSQGSGDSSSSVPTEAPSLVPPTISVMDASEVESSLHDSANIN
ncbi:uncharacterized protein SAPINGB_P001898 [Magnusiomyces paraingens]|uniref:Rho-GAP domain-containing protein n=1 Tax=Magnusiomyces paraingens TaxID=2606893 RepID=A0A5E8BC75_9ASCO|nr:uncharacterized protein SAPINGB_P001898 [Saprochaete ingens]VVT48680.1 unnamed protein product [Saprochaete ingens]